MKGMGIYRILPACGFVSLLSLCLCGCSDDTMDMKNTVEREIRFEIGGIRGTSAANSTRGADYKPSNAGVLTLSGGETPLYLVPRVRSGIDVDKNCASESATRGSLVTTDNLLSAGVFASQNSGGNSVETLVPDYMFNVEITSSGAWTPTEKYLWPGMGSLHINSYSPFCGTPGNDGITRLPMNGEPGPVKVSYSVPGDVKEQEDLLWSTPVDASSSPCELTFNHALTAIRFVTGAEMGPCKVESIEIKGILSQGILNLETGEWTDLGETADYVVSPELSLDTADGSQFVESGIQLTTDEDTFLLLPQALGEDAEIVLTVSKNGQSFVLEASLSGETWEPGKTITYRLSANPSKDELVLDVNGDFTTNYTGETVQFTVDSELDSNGSSSPVDWKAEFVDASGNVIAQPNWITSFTLRGKGESQCSYSTEMQDIVFNTISEQSRILQNAGNINSTSGFTPYNLSNSNGGATVENTANSYIINAPGKYSLPLVYGNGIKNGAGNSAAYVSTSHNRYALKGFVNHLGNAISDPYIYNNSGCEPSDAVLLWEDELNLVRNVALSEDKKSITFDIPHNTIRQGNALIAVRDMSGTVMWSWQIWVTDYVPSSNSVSITADGSRHVLYTRNLGSVVGGDKVTFTPCTVLVRFSQINVPEGMEPLTKTVKVTQNGIMIATGDYNTYYQWGRKDPMMSAVKQWYNADHKELKELTINSSTTDGLVGEKLIAAWIKTPDTFWETSSAYRYSFTNLWNTSLVASGSEKSVYDPSPIGAKVPSGEEFLYLFQSGTFTWGMSGESSGFIVTAPDMTGTLFFTALGYRSLASGIEQSNGITGEYWSARAATNREDATCLTMQHKDDGSVALGHSDYRGHAFGVRPAFE